MKEQKYPTSELDSQELGRTKGENSIKFEFKVNVVSKTVQSHRKDTINNEQIIHPTEYHFYRVKIIQCYIISYHYHNHLL